MKIVAITTVALVLGVVYGDRLQERYAWKQLEFDWPTPAEREERIASGKYVPGNNLPVGIEVWQNKLFMTVPRWLPGVAAPLAYVDMNDPSTSPILKPYPNWEASELPSNTLTDPVTGAKMLENNETIVSVFRIRADKCDRLWVIDTGLDSVLGDAKQIVPTSIAIFDLKTDTLLRRAYFNDKMAKEDSFFANIIVDVDENNCDDAYAYVPDLGAYGVVVYSLADDKMWRVKHNFFHFDPLHGDYNVSGYSFQWTDGVFGMSLSNKLADGSRTVYFHALSSTKEFSVSNKVLQNETRALSAESYFDYSLVGDRGNSSQATAEHFDEQTGVIFFTQVNRDGVTCWNTRKPLTPETCTVVDSDQSTLIFPNDLKVDSNGTLWVISDKMPIFLYGTLDHNLVNYRVFKGNTKTLIEGTPCDN